MPDLGPHAVFIIAAYVAAFAAIAALAFAIVDDDRKQRRMLAELEHRGIRRRSAATAAPKAPRTEPTPPRTPKASGRSRRS